MTIKHIKPRFTRFTKDEDYDPDRRPEYRLEFPAYYDNATKEHIPLPNKILFTGAARSGTQWLREVVEFATGLPHDRVLHEPIPWGGYHDPNVVTEHIEKVVLADMDDFIEVNCYAQHGLKYWEAVGGKIIHIIRDPHDTARSYVRTGFNPLGMRYLTKLAELGYMDYEQALLHWAEQHLRIMQHPVFDAHHIEELWEDYDLFVWMVDSLEIGTPSCDWKREKHRQLERLWKKKKDNHTTRPYPKVPHPHDMPEHIKALAKELGYDNY